MSRQFRSRTRPANFRQISTLLIKLQDLKIAQADTIAAEQRARLELLEPGKGKEAGTLATLKDKSGKVLASVLLGKKYMRKADGAPDPGYPAGRYVMVSGDEQTVATVGDPLLEFEPKVENWIAKDFAKIEKLKSIAVTGNDGVAKWKLTRDKDGAEWQLMDKTPKEQFDQANGVAIANGVTAMNFVDVATNPKPEDTGLQKPATVTIETFDNLTYTLKIGKESGENSYLAMSVNGEPAKQRQPQPNEKPEDKEKLDKAYQEQLGKLEARLKNEKQLVNWIYLVPKWRVDTLLKERAKLMVEKAQVIQPLNPDGTPKTQ
jgi:Domain of unknown function (DUF4340)